MSNLVDTNQPADCAGLAAALRNGDVAAAERIAGRFGPDALRSLAESLMRCRRWADAAWLLDRIQGGNVADHAKRCLAKNLAALRVHRPKAYDLLVELPDDERFGIAPSVSGALTILAHNADGSAVSLAAGGGDPAAGAAQVIGQLKRQILAGEAIALCGAGDGYVLAQLSATKVHRFLGMEQALFLLEPEARILLLCLMIHDFTGPSGPIEQDRVRWFVGSNWASDLAEALEADAYLGLPGVSIAQGTRGPEARTGLQALTARVLEDDKRIAQELANYHQLVGPSELADVLAGRAGRKPRVMLLTTRFSTVLQYSTRDTARGFEEAGWDAHVVIEPSPSHRLYQPALRRAMHEFRPDLVFQIDHLRHEHGALFPPGLPFVCWIQDHLPHLKTAEAGRKVGPLDFVLTDAPSTYVRTYGYPRRQCLPLPKLTSIQPETPAAVDEWENDIAFVSNASATPDTLFAAAEQEFRETPAAVPILREVGRQILEIYAAGGCVQTYNDVLKLVHDSSPAVDGETLLQVARWLTHPFNDSLYRQQALSWVAAAARGAGWRLAIYGNGWERNKDFAAYARGPIAYGSPLEALTRRTKVNLQVVPYPCLHQRLLDGLAAGGFFLARKHVSDVAPQAMSNLLAEHFLPAVRTLDAARASAPPPVRERFETLVAECRSCLCSMGAEDPIEMVRDLEEASLIVPGADILPHFAEMAFDSEASLRERLLRFIGDAGARRTIAAAQREDIASRFSYAAGMGRVAEFVARGLSRASTRDLARAAAGPLFASGGRAA